MGAATMVVIYRTEHVFKNILLFWVLCALEENCIQPTQRKWCEPDKLRAGLYAGRLGRLVEPYKLRAGLYAGRLGRLVEPDELRAGLCR